MTEKTPKIEHYHPLVFLEFFKKYLILAIIPLVTALVHFELEALFVALKQEAVLLSVLFLYAYLRWLNSGWSLEKQNVLYLKDSFILSKKQMIPLDNFSAVMLDRPLIMRVFSATKVTLFFKKRANGKKITLTLPKNSAEKLAEQILPMQNFPQENCKKYKLTTLQQAVLGLVSGNIISTVFIFVLSVYNLGLISNWAREFALRPLEQTVQFVATLLPSAVAVIIGFAAFFTVLSLAVSLFHNAKHSVVVNGDVLLFESGIVFYTQCRVRRGDITHYILRKAPIARLLGHVPLYVVAGTFNSLRQPAFFVSKKNSEILCEILPDYYIPKPKTESIYRRGTLPFFWFSGGFSLLFFLLMIGSYRVNPTLIMPFAVVMWFFIAMMCVNLEGFFKECVSYEDMRLSFVFVRFFTLYQVCFLKKPPLAKVEKNLVAWFTKRVTLRFFTSGGQKYTIHSILFKNCPSFYL